MTQIRARMYDYTDHEGASNGGGTTAKLCFNDTVHLFHAHSWYDQSGCEKSAYNYEVYEVIGPCDGSCRSGEDLPPYAESLIQKFIVSGGKEKSKWEKQTPIYPPEKYPWLYKDE